MSAASGTALIDVGATDVIIEDLSLVYTRSSGAGAVQGINLSGADVSGFQLRNAYLEGAEVSSTSVTHGITFGNATTAYHCLLDNVYFKQHNFALFTANSFGSTGNTAKHWVIRNCTLDTIKRGFSFNSDFATSSVTNAWQHVLVDGCTFINSTTDVDRCTAVTGDSCVNLTVTNCVFKDRTGTDGVIHIENYMFDPLVYLDYHLLIYQMMHKIHHEI